jgi:predicted PurR-regulated permease PerM
MIEYLLIGILFAFFVEWIVDYLQKTGTYYQRHLTNLERILCVLIWPIGLIVFLRGFIVTIFKNNNDE